RQDNLSTAAPTTSSVPCLSNHRNKEHLILAFCVGVLLTLLLMAFIFLIIKSYRKYRERLPISPGSLLRWVPLLSGTTAGHPKPQALDPHTDPPAMLSSIPEESLACANMTFKHSEEKSNHSAENRSADFDPIVYAQIIVKN
uniref:Chromosome 1 open reading frame 162 n=1 Tax=Saimiri boliviensis boliviensis TaxID=39432 RepID=A0A2K6V6D1_SAIBB